MLAYKYLQSNEFTLIKASYFMCIQYFRMSSYFKVKNACITTQQLNFFNCLQVSKGFKKCNS